MKTKPIKEELDRSTEDEATPELTTKTRAQKKAAGEELNKANQEEPKKPRKTVVRKPKGLANKKTLGVRKTLRNKKVIIAKNKLKNVVTQGKRRGRKPTIKVEPQEDEPATDSDSLISPLEIKKEPVDETSPGSRSSSPKSQGKRVRLSSDMAMMKSLLLDSPTNLVVGPRTSPYSMRSERSNSPSLPEGKKRGRKPKTKLLNEVVKNEQKKRRLLSDSKGEPLDDDSKKRGRSHSRDGSEISKCSDITESDISETVSIDADKSETPEQTQKLDKTKTDIDVNSEPSIPISTIVQVPFNDDSKLATETDHSNILVEGKKKSLKRSTSLDSDNNNGRNRLKLDKVRTSSDVEGKSKIKRKTDKDSLFKTRSSILSSMSKTFNSKDMIMNIRKVRRGRKPASAKQAEVQPKTSPSITSGIEPIESGSETLESLTKEINELISTLEDDKPQENIKTDDTPSPVEVPTPMMPLDVLNQTKSVSKFYGLSEVKPLTDSNILPQTIEVPAKDKESWNLSSTIAPPKIDDSENIKLYLDDNNEKEKTTEVVKENEATFKPVASIDKLMDRLKVFEEFDKKRQQTEQQKTGESKTVMVTNDVVLIPKSGADIKPLKDIQSVRSPERPMQKENVLSCFENNSAISIMKRDHVRKSMDVDLPNSVTLIKRNSVHARKESTGSNHSRESSDTVMIFEKSLGKDVTLTEIRKSIDKSAPTASLDIHQFATLQPVSSPGIIGVKIDSNEISITPRTTGDQTKVVPKLKLQDLSLMKTTDNEIAEIELLSTTAKIKSPQHVTNSQMKSPTSIIPPVAIKSPEALPIETEASAPPLETVKAISDNISMTSDTPRVEEMIIPETSVTNINDAKLEEESNVQNEEKPMVVDNEPPKEVGNELPELESKAPIEDIVDKETVAPKEVKNEAPKELVQENEVKTVPDLVKPMKAQGKSKSGRKSIESQPGPSSALLETPESQKDKESILRTLGLLTHKAANEAKIEKQKQKEKMYAKTYGLGGVNKSKAPKSGDYTGTLKTIIKLNRGNGEREKGKKYRSSLKMTFQKSKNRAGKAAPDVEAEVVDEPFYTIERREGTGIQSTEGQRKSYSNRNNPNNHDGNPAAPTDVQEVPKEPTLNLVIPEKASSFSIHPGRLCLDQCSYCGGKFGLFDTPCHIAQMKSAERQKKVLDNEEKLTIDSCLCDACYRHVDRRANCPSYRKRPLPKALAIVEPAPVVNTELNTPPVEKPSPVEKPPSPPVFDDESSGESAASLVSGAVCHARGCGVSAVHAVRRKWLIKMKTKVHDLLELELDYPGLHTIPLCGAHHRALLPLITCRLCNRNKHHNLHLLKHGYLELNPLLAKEGIPVEFTDRPVLCKLCRYYCTLLQRPGFHDKNAKTYRNRLLQIYNIEIPPETEVETDDKIKDEKSDLSITIKQKKKNKAKSKQRKSIEPELINDNAINEPIVEIREGHEETKTDDPMDANQPEHMEEDIESLISSNKILNPSKPSSGEVSMQSDFSDQELLQDLEGPLIPFDKQTELQYLLQKQNNPAQFLKKNVTNLTPKQKNIFKTLNITIQKSGQQQKILDKNAKKIQKIGQMIIGQGEKSPVSRPEEIEEAEKAKEAGIAIIKNMSLNDECTIETIPNKKPADINTLKNKWQMSESFTQVKKNLSELSKKTTTEMKKPAEPKISNPVKRLETNPSISVRELFPGEDEMNLQCNIDFHNVKGITPEGWEKCNTTIQYDSETKKLWNELQRPYGNQSSFLRHLILLEKYFRGGDLILSNNATAHASVYSDSVQNRLKAYDNVPNNEHRPASLMKKPSVNGKSLLKSNNQNVNEIEKVPEMKKPLPPGTFVKPKPKTDGKAKTKTLPPELISIHTPNAQGRKAIQNVLHNIQQLVKDVSAADPIGIASAPLPPPKVELPKPEVPKVDPVKPAKKQKSSSKPWRPTLMPITPENLAKIAREQPQIAVDGRSLPSLVQVLSSGKRFHITLQDYNKMCVMRREKLQQLQDGDGKSKPDQDNTIITEVQLSSKLGNGGTVRQTFDKDTEKPEINDNIQLSMSAANILKNVGLKNITIAPIPPKMNTGTSQINLGPNVTSQMNLIPNVTSQMNLVPNVTSQISFLQPVTSHSNSLPNLMSQINLVPNVTSQMSIVPNVTSQINLSKMNSVPNVMSQMSSVQSVMSQMSSIPTVMPQLSSIQTVTSPSLLVTSTPIKLQQLTTLATEPLITNVSPVVSNASTSVLPKMPKSLTVIPQSSTNTAPNVSNDAPTP